MLIKKVSISAWKSVSWSVIPLISQKKHYKWVHCRLSSNHIAFYSKHPSFARRNLVLIRVKTLEYTHSISSQPFPITYLLNPIILNQDQDTENMCGVASICWSGINYSISSLMAATNWVSKDWPPTTCCLPSPETPPQARLCRAQRGTRWRCCPCTSRGASWCRPCAATASGPTSPCRPPLPAPRARHCSPGRRGDPGGPEWCTCIKRRKSVSLLWENHET